LIKKKRGWGLNSNGGQSHKKSINNMKHYIYHIDIYCFIILIFFSFGIDINIIFVPVGINVILEIIFHHRTSPASHDSNYLGLPTETSEKKILNSIYQYGIYSASYYIHY
jgi:hypothetical protein